MNLSTIITAVFLFFFAAFPLVHCLENPQIDELEQSAAGLGEAADLEYAWQNASSVFDSAPSGLNDAPSVSAADASGKSGKAAFHRNYAYLMDLKEVLSAGRWHNSQPAIRHFMFRDKSGTFAQAQSAGLEGFFYTKKELEGRFGEQAYLHHLGDYFNYLDALLAPVSWTRGFRQDLRELRNSDIPAEEKNKQLNSMLEDYISGLQSDVMKVDSAQWIRKARIYELFPRAYNTQGRRGTGGFRSPADPAKTLFFRDFKISDFQVIKRMGFNTVWPMGIFPIGERNQSGTGGGSPFSVKDHSAINPALGTGEDFRQFVQKAHQAGLRVIIDFVVNHTSMDSRLLDKNPAHFIHKIPTPGENSPPQGYFDYQWHGSRVWVHHGGFESYGGISMWIDTAQVDYSRYDTRRERMEMVRSWVERFDVDGFRVDMAYIVLNTVFARAWRKNMPQEEFLAYLVREVKAVKPSVAFIAEAYADQDDISACGFDLIYSKYETSRPEGQTGWYDATAGGNNYDQQSGINRTAFLAWQKGGAGSVSFVGNHDEKAPKRVYGARLPSALMMTMLLPGSVLVYSGAEIGVDHAVPWEEKPLPFSVPVEIDWNGGDPGVKAVYEHVFAVSNRIRDELGDYDIEPIWPSNGEKWVGYVMKSRTHPGMKKAVIGNITWQGTSVNGNFYLQPGEYRIINL